ncbi:MAG: VOC family protein [Candidatus Kerfeldbacteria bacterium]|nr:VOC family protein [Candidatus Kerfeldbacteria bacterium]
MIDHVSFRVSDFQRSKKFYSAILGVLGYTIAREAEDKMGFRSPEGAGVWLRKEDYLSQGMHVAFRAKNKEIVERFYKTGLENGGTGNGAPGPRPHREDQYIAFLHDPDGNNIEIVYRSKKK